MSEALFTQLFFHALIPLAGYAAWKLLKRRPFPAAVLTLALCPICQYAVARGVDSTLPRRELNPEWRKGRPRAFVGCRRPRDRCMV